MPLLKVQHRPIRVSFKWEVLWQTGFVLFKPAPLILDRCNQGCDLPVEPDSFAFDSSLSINEVWTRANDDAIGSLLHQGACWGPGPRERGTQIQFKPKQMHFRLRMHSIIIQPFLELRLINLSALI